MRETRDLPCSLPEYRCVAKGSRPLDLPYLDLDSRHTSLPFRISSELGRRWRLILGIWIP